MPRPNLINSRTVFTATLIIIPALTFIVYLSGINEHRSLYYNSILSTTILSVVFLIFITTGLYRGWKLKENVGNLMNKLDKLERPSAGSSEGLSHLDIPDVSDDEGCLFSIVGWIIVGVFGTVILWSVGAFLWAAVLVIAALLYWIIFRSYRLIFRNSAKCKNNFSKSFSIALLFTLLYSCWIYAIIFGTHFLKN